MHVVWHHYDLQVQDMGMWVLNIINQISSNKQICTICTISSLCGSLAFRVIHPKCMELPLWVHPMAAYPLLPLSQDTKGGRGVAKAWVACLPQTGIGSLASP
jgi:hypothetical protein